MGLDGKTDDLMTDPELQWVTNTQSLLGYKNLRRVPQGYFSEMNFQRGR